MSTPPLTGRPFAVSLGGVSAFDRTANGIRLCLACLGLLVCSGCAVLVVGGAAAAGAGTVLWVKGQLTANVDAPLERVWAASQEALNQLRMPVTSQEKDALQGTLIARAAGDKKVTVQLKKVSGTTTQVGIRVGTWGDQVTSQQILDAIRARL